MLSGARSTHGGHHTWRHHTMELIQASQKSPRNTDFLHKGAMGSNFGGSLAGYWCFFGLTAQRHPTTRPPLLKSHSCFVSPPYSQIRAYAISRSKTLWCPLSVTNSLCTTNLCCWMYALGGCCQHWCPPRSPAHGSWHQQQLCRWALANPHMKGQTQSPSSHL